MYNRDDGVPAHEIAHPPHLAPVLEAVVDEPFNEPLSLRHLLEQHLKRLEANGGGVSARKGWTRCFEDPLQFLKVSRGLKGFHSADADPKKLPAQAVSARVGKWLQSEKLIPEGVQPNRGWRHRFKTQSREAGLDPHVVDSIQGHTGRTASDGYGDVTLRTKKAAIYKLSGYDAVV